MYSPTTRLLTLLELLQSRGSVTGPEVAERLEVDVRSVRRYITMLRDMGIPVDSEKGRYGYYSLRPGFRLPPLMFNEPEIMAVILGLVAVRRLGMTSAPGVESAVAKIARVLPDELRQHAEALQTVLTLDFDLPSYTNVNTSTLGLFSIAAHSRQQLWITYMGGRQDLTERAVDIYGLVFHAGAWYAPAFCHLRGDLRVFRLDRVQKAYLLEDRFTPPADFDALGHLLNTIAGMPGTWEVHLLLLTTLKQARDLIPADMAMLDEHPRGVWMRCYSDNLDWLARFMARTGLKFVILQPEALRATFRTLAHDLLTIADAQVTPDAVQGRLW